MNDDAMKITCMMLGFDIQAFDDWLEGLDDGPAKRELTDRRHRLADWFGNQSAFRLNLEDEESCAVFKHHIDHLMLQWSYLRRQDALLPAHRKERNRIENLPTADKRHSIWREVAEQVRKETGLKSKSAVAAAVHKRLLKSDRKDYREAVRSPDTISRKI